jgi:Fe-S cluster biosynthesis and repair protein YggX
MPDLSQRIEQFRKMTDADPSNELGHFSLARAYLEAANHELAIASFRRALQINPNMSKAYQLLADAFLKLNQTQAAIAELTHGVKIADARGDLMPRNEMIALLKNLNAPVPQLQHAATPTAEINADQVQCARCGQIGNKLPSPPFRNAMGQEIQQKICADCWKAWIAMGTKVINEMRLPLSDPQAQKIFDQHMIEFLNLR